MIRIQSATYFSLPGTNPEYKKFDSLKYSVTESAVYTTVSGQVTAWAYTVVVGLSATATATGISAGGLDSLRASFAIPSALQIVTDEAVTATAYFRSLKTRQILNPTTWQMDVGFTKA